MDIETLYGCKEVPDIKISLMENNKIVFSFENNGVIKYDYQYGTNKDMLYITLCVMNPMTYYILISKTYDKYIIEGKNTWRSQKTGKDEWIENPARIFTNFSIQNCLNIEDPTQWHLTFWNEVQ